MRRECFLGVVLAGFLLILPVFSQAEDFSYTTSNDEITITGYSGTNNVVVIPETINGLPVTTIAAEAFRDCSGLTTVAIPSSVSIIGNWAFYGCSSLTSVTIPDGVTSIGFYVFGGCRSLASVTIPSSVTFIGQWAFAGCISLTNLTVPSSVTMIGNYAFDGCSGLTAITVAAGNPNYMSADGVLYSGALGAYSALLCPVAKTGTVTIPDGVTSIGDLAFNGCINLSSVTIPSSVTSIGNEAFSGCAGLSSVTIPDGVTSIGYYAFRGCSSLASVTIPSSVTSIELFVFDECSGLTAITVAAGNPNYMSADGVLYSGVPGAYSVMFCPVGKMGTVTISDGVTSIGSYAFRDCSGLTSVTIPNDVTLIEYQAFYNCSGLTGPLTIPSSVTSIGDRAFYNCSGLTGSLMIPDSVTSIGGAAFYGCSGFSGVLTIPEGVTMIGGYAFYGCSGLTSVTIPSSVTMIGGYPFADCSNLTTITVAAGNPELISEDGVLFIKAYDGSRILVQCPAGKTGSYTIPSDVTNMISLGAFIGCRGLTGTLTISEGVENINLNSFSGCSGLTGLVIPSSVIYISQGGVFEFENFSNLTAITVAAENPAYMSEDGVLFDKNQTTLIQCPGGKTGDYTVPSSVTAIGDIAFLGCRQLTSVSIPAATTSIGFWAFRDCGATAITVEAENPLYMSIDGVLFNKSQTTLLQCPGGRTGDYTVPSSVTAIDDYAFMFSSLTSVTVPAGVTSIGHGAFRPCYGLQAIHVAAENPNYMSVDGVLFNKSQTQLIQCPGTKSGHYTVPYGVTSIDDFAFEGCRQLTGITVPSSTSLLGRDLFFDCGAPQNVYFQGDAPARNRSSYEEKEDLIVYRLSGTAFWGVLYYGHTVVLWNPGAEFSYTTDNGEVTITGYSGTNEVVVIPETIDGLPVTAIGADAFADSILAEISIPFGVTSIGNFSFARCGSLISLTIPDGVTSIGDWAFDGCRGLTGSVAIPSSVTSIGVGAFCGCSGLTSTLTIPSGVASIGDWAFDDCSGLTSVTISAGVTSIGKASFQNCSGLTSVALPDSVTFIGDWAFYGCTSLTGITIPEGVTSIGYCAFSYCSNLSRVTIPSSVTSIKDYAFYDCVSLTRVTIPEGVTSIGGDAFYSCDSLSEVYFQGDAPTFGGGSLPDNNMAVYYPSGTTGWGSTYGGHPVVLWNPQVEVGDASFGMKPGGFGFDISGTNDYTVVVEVCTNLASGVWTPLQTNTLNGSFSFIDPQATNRPSGYYRLSMP